MSYSWFRQGTCTVGASDVVRFQGANITTAPNKPVVGDAFTVGGFRFYEIIFIGSDATGEYIRLNKAYEEAAGSNISYAVARFASGTQNAKLVAMASAAINQKQISLDDMYEWYTSQADTVQFLGPDGTFTTLTTYFKLSQEITAVGGNAGAITVVANNINDVKAVAGNMAAINTITPSIPAINAANDNMPAITAVNSEIQSVITVSENIPLLNAITPSIPAINNVNNNIATIAAVNADMVSVKNVSDNMADVKDAKPQADRAESEADRAEVEANKAMMAVTALYAMTEAQFETNRTQNRIRFAASGYESFGKVTNGNNDEVTINQGLFTQQISINTLRAGRLNSQGGTGTSKSEWPIVHVAGVLFDLKYISYNGLYTFNEYKFPPAPDGKTTYNKATGINTVHASSAAAFAAQAADPTNVEVVINRVDMWGKEVWAEEVSATNPYIYPNGLPQSLAITMDGITTSSSNRPVSYYAFFSGDSLSKGKGLNFFSLTDSQKKKVLANPRNNLVLLNDGRLIQWRLRVRTFVGLGNGDWNRIENTSVDAINFQGGFYTTAQGNRDIPATVINNDNIYLTTSHPDGAMSIGGFSTAINSPLSASGVCYFLVGGTIKRLNQGAYHPSFNPSGAAVRCYLVSGIVSKWFENTGDTSLVNEVACFDRTSGYEHNKVRDGSIGTPSGRPDDRHYDAIYADGDGGVCRDMRYSAYGKTIEDYAEADQRVKNREYRGFEKPSFSKFHQNAFIGYFNVENSNHAFITNGPNGSGGGVDFYGSTWGLMAGLIAYQPATGLIAYGTLSDTNGAIRVSRISTNKGVPYSHIQGTLGSSTSLPWYFVDSRDLNYSIGGSFLQTDVIGNPAGILAITALTNGWVGSWIKAPSIVEGVIVARKSIQSTCNITYTSNNGATWSNIPTYPLHFETNKTDGINPIDTVVCQYLSFARQTEPVVNATVYGEDSGIGKVFQNSWYGLSTFQETLIGKVATGVFGGDSLLVTKYNLDGESKLHTDPSATPRHLAIDLPAPVNNSVGIKALNYNVNINQQAFTYYAYTELKHNGTSWGDDGKITIVNNQVTKTDLNGNTVLVGTAKLKEPIGWVKNKD